MEDRIWKLYIHEFPNGKVYIGITHRSVYDAHRKLSIGKSSISRVYRGERESVCGFVFKFKDGDLNG